MFMSSGEAEELTRTTMTERGYCALQLVKAFGEAAENSKKIWMYSDSDFTNSLLRLSEFQKSMLKRLTEEVKKDA
jgi:hypothetical protein